MKALGNHIRMRPAFALTIVLAAATLALLGATSSTQAAGRNPNPGILPIGSTPHGMSYSEWAAAWWQWVYSYPAGADSNPVEDPTGALCGLGDQGPVWFLAGTRGTTVVRDCTIPAGKTLFFPIINSLWINIPELGDNPWSDEQQEFALSVIEPFVDKAYKLSCTIDGVPVENLASYRATTPDDGEYFITVPDGSPVGLPAGTYGPAVDDGIYLMLTPLKPGKHTIRFTSASKGTIFGDFALDVTYHLTVR